MGDCGCAGEVLKPAPKDLGRVKERSASYLFYSARGTKRPRGYTSRRAERLLTFIKVSRKLQPWSNQIRKENFERMQLWSRAGKISRWEKAHLSCETDVSTEILLRKWQQTINTPKANIKFNFIKLCKSRQIFLIVKHYVPPWKNTRWMQECDVGRVGTIRRSRGKSCLQSYVFLQHCRA